MKISYIYNMYNIGKNCKSWLVLALQWHKFMSFCYTLTWHIWMYFKVSTAIISFIFSVILYNLLPVLSYHASTETKCSFMVSKRLTRYLCKKIHGKLSRENLKCYSEYYHSCIFDSLRNILQKIIDYIKYSKWQPDL